MSQNVGALPSTFFKNQYGKFDEFNFNDYWENQLANLLANDIADSEKKLADYEEDKIYIKCEISDKILDYLITEIMGFFI